MKFSIRLLLAFFVTSTFTLHSEIIEVKEFKEILQYTTPETLVLLDIDDTLLIPVQTLGTDVWFIYRIDHHLKQTNDRSSALDKALADWEAVRHLTKVKIVENGTEKIIDYLQKNGVIVMGLTTQGLALATRTINQLNSLAIDLSLTAPSKDDCYFINGKHGVLYRNGVLFTSGTAKGEAVIKLLEILQQSPKHIVFINDKKTHLLDVEKTVSTKNINFTGLRYSYSDERVANFSKEIADYQWTHSTFDHIISDEEAAYSLDSF